MPGVRRAYFQPTRIVTVVSRQLTLDLGTPPPATFDNFIMNEENDELISRLQKLDLALAAGPVPDRSFYIWASPAAAAPICCRRS